MSDSQTALGGESLAMALCRCQHELELRIRPTMIDLGLTPEQCRILAVLATKPGTRMSALARDAVIPPASLTRNVDKLVERALVVRHLDDRDRRQVVAALSSLGMVAAERLRAREREIESEIEGRLGSRVMAGLVGGLVQLPETVADSDHGRCP